MNQLQALMPLLYLCFALAGCIEQNLEEVPGIMPLSIHAPIRTEHDPRLQTPPTGDFIRPLHRILKGHTAWFEQIRDVPLGQHVFLREDTKRDIEAWANLGFVVHEAGGFRREAELTAELPGLVLTDLPEISEIDCVALISIDRLNGDPPYLYPTLRSLFKAFPRGTHINVLVGDDNLAYVAADRLAEEIGEENLAMTHIWPTSAATTAYLKTRLPANRRGGWNYTRALRSYNGSKGLVLMEDDVEWAAGGIERFNAYVKGRKLPAVSLFNDRCEKLSGTSDYLSSELAFNEVNTEHFAFWNLQGMYYSSSITGALGRWVQIHMHQAVYDNVIGLFFTANKTTIAYAFPSIVQHIGRYTACNSAGFHTIGCFRESF